MISNIPPKTRIDSVIFEMDDSRVEEDWESISLFWRETKGQIVKLIFGKRANFYYNCLRDLSDDDIDIKQRCQCFLKASRRTYDINKGKNHIKLNKSANDIFHKKGWFGLFNAEKFRGGGETVVIEEKRNQISFHFRLDVADKGCIFFYINNDEGIKCNADRECAGHPRVSYTTFRNVFYEDKPSPLFG